MKTAFLFPGQGAQSVGMGKVIYEANVTYRKTFDRICAASGVDLNAACFEGIGLDVSAVIQPAIYAHSLSLLAAIGETADVYAGLSLGEYTALTAAGVIDMEKGAALVNKRGAMMDAAVPDGMGAMISVLGLNVAQVEAIVKDIANVWVANHLSETQVVIGGKKDVLSAIESRFIEIGAKTVFINVSGPFHTPMLDETAKKFKEILEDTDLKQPNAIIYSNYTANPYASKHEVPELLARQMCGRVRWHETMENLITDGIKKFVEIGPSMVLSKMLKRRLKGEDIEIISIRDLKSFEKYMTTKGAI